MRFSQLLPIALMGAVSAVPVTDVEKSIANMRRQVPVLTCSHLTGGIHMIFIGGANTANEKDYGYLSATAEAILAGIPGSTNVSLPYDKVFETLTPPTLYPGAVANGSVTLKQYIVDYHHYCPHTKIGIVGYSSGGIIMMNNICHGGNGVGTIQINPSLVGSTLIGAVAYGEETRVAGQSYNTGTCQGNYDATAPRADPALCDPFAGILQSYCDLEDPDCCVGSGDNLSVHYSYPTTYDSAVVSFFQQKLAAAGGA